MAKKASAILEENGIKIHCAHDEMVLVEDLKPNPKNRNHHPEDQIIEMMEIIKGNGMRRQIIVSKRSGFMTAGHCRLEACRRLGMKRVPVNYQPYKSAWHEYADMTADNRLAARAELDLNLVLSDLPDFGKDVDLRLAGLDDTEKTVNTVNKGDENSAWVGMPDFTPGDKEIRLTLVFKTERARAKFVEGQNINVTSKHSNQWLSRL